MSIKGSTFITFTAKTDSRAKKKNNPHGIIWKTYTVNGLVNFQYDQAVLNRLEKEGKGEEDFKRGESWHELVKTSQNLLTPFARHKENGELYLRFWLLTKSKDTVYTNSQDEILNFDDIKELLPKPSKYDNQGLDNPVKIQTYKLSSILIFNVNDRVYKLNHGEEVLTFKDLEL